MNRKLKCFIALETGFSEDKILIKTRLYHEICLDGDEAEEFIEVFAEAFDVDMNFIDTLIKKALTHSPFLVLYLELVAISIE
ncbi:hypothetical protein M3I01_008575 [Marinomonas sp. RSW2]|uniref:Uncharacterized protein n=1 Tax=Marinomonas maritima TaxID=2940935 RepID=A0ABT5WDS6_9GAMM|nr:hypothetical protein [Marinomonas maritima]MDE8602977.1 hypothetical protein [Marinomonas maritima]